MQILDMVRQNKTFLAFGIFSVFLERSIGELHKMASGSSQFFVLRELLACHTLETIFGSDSVILCFSLKFFFDFLILKLMIFRIILGNSGFNLRNIFWHGFFTDKISVTDIFLFLISFCLSLAPDFLHYFGQDKQFHLDFHLPITRLFFDLGFDPFCKTTEFDFFLLK